MTRAELEAELAVVKHDLELMVAKRDSWRANADHHAKEVERLREEVRLLRAEAIANLSGALVWFLLRLGDPGESLHSLRHLADIARKLSPADAAGDVVAVGKEAR